MKAVGFFLLAVALALVCVAGVFAYDNARLANRDAWKEYPGKVGGQGQMSTRAGESIEVSWTDETGEQFGRAQVTMGTLDRLLGLTTPGGAQPIENTKMLVYQPIIGSRRVCVAQTFDECSGLNVSWAAPVSVLVIAILVAIGGVRGLRA